MRNTIFAIILIAITSAAAAASPFDAPPPATCPLTPSLATEPKPGREQMHSFNNLAQPPGKFAAASGQLLVLEGVVQDRFCRPVPDALVELWQMDASGNYAYPSRRVLNAPDPVFAGSGRMRTDQFGRFRFVTVFPGAAGDLAPYVNLAVSTHDAEYQGRMYFAGDQRNAGDPILARLAHEERPAVEADMTPLSGNGLRAHIAVTIDTRPRFRRH